MEDDTAVLRIHSELDEHTEACAAAAIDAGFTVHSEVGPGYGEAIYRKSFSVTYRGHVIGVHGLDVVVQDCVPIEMKAIRNYDPAHMAQVMAYLKASRLRIGLLMNFACATFKEGLKRIVVVGGPSFVSSCLLVFVVVSPSWWYRLRGRVFVVKPW